jgi:hypothetical protein
LVLAVRPVIITECGEVEAMSVAFPTLVGFTSDGLVE